jgi:D-xylose transport system substrate-binding protein
LKVSKRFVLVAALCVTVVATSSFLASGRVLAARSQAPITGKVGFLFADFTTSNRWAFDRDYFKANLKKLDPQVQVIVTDSKTQQTNQLNQAKSDLTAGVKVLIDVPVDAGAAQIVKAAHQSSPRVPVLAYDRLITGAKEDAYASFDGFSVGVKQGTYIKNHVKKGGTIVEIAGAATDNNAHLFHNGARSVLDPLFKSGALKLGYFKFTPNWDGATAEKEMASALNSLSNKVDGVLVANDNMAVFSIQALKAQHLAGKIPVTGQDAAVAGLQQILLGNQSMTVYKPIAKLSVAAAHIVDVWLHGKTFTSSTTIATGAGPTPSALAKVITVTKANIKSTVLADGYVKRSDPCKGIPASACAGL